MYFLLKLFVVEFFETSSVSPTLFTPSLTSQHSKLSSFPLVSSAYISKVQMETASYSSPMMVASKVSSMASLYSVLAPTASSYQHHSIKTSPSFVWERTHFLVTSSAASETMAKFSVSCNGNINPLRGGKGTLRNFSLANARWFCRWFYQFGPTPELIIL